MSSLLKFDSSSSILAFVCYLGHANEEYTFTLYFKILAEEPPSLAEDIMCLDVVSK